MRPGKGRSYEGRPMMNLWSLPQSLKVGGKDYKIFPDFRNVLRVFACFQQEELPEFFRWEMALALFYQEEIPMEHRREAMEKMSLFLCAGRPEKPGPKLLDWEHDAPLIVADVNKVAGTEVRSMEFLHWWTFLGWFHALGEGQLSTVVAIRSKLARGKKLDEQEQEFYRLHKELVDLPRHYTREELSEKERLLSLLQ